MISGGFQWPWLPQIGLNWFFLFSGWQRELFLPYIVGTRTRSPHSIYMLIDFNFCLRKKSRWLSFKNNLDLLKVILAEDFWVFNRRISDESICMEPDLRQNILKYWGNEIIKMNCWDFAVSCNVLFVFTCCKVLNVIVRFVKLKNELEEILSQRWCKILSWKHFNFK